MSPATPPQNISDAEKTWQFAIRPWRRIAVFLIACVCLAVAFVVILGAFWFYSFNYEGSEVTLTIVNHTNQPIQSADAFSDSLPFLHLGFIAPGGKRQGIGHFWSAEGAGFLELHFAGKTQNTGLGHVLLNDNGPFEFEITIEPDRVHVKDWAESKGSGAFDEALSDGSVAAIFSRPASRK